MKQALSTILFLTISSCFSQQVIFESNMDKEKQLPHELSFSKWNNSLLIAKGTFKGAIRSYNSLDEMSLNDFTTKTIFKDQKLLGIKQSVADNIFFGTEHSGVGWAKDDKIIDAKGNILASKKLNVDYKYVTNEKVCFISDKKGEGLGIFKSKDEIYFSTLNIKDLSLTTIKIDKPDFLTDFKGERFISPNYFKDFFELSAYKLEDEGTTLVDKWVRYDYTGKIILTDERKIILQSPLIFTDVDGGRSNEGVRLMYHENTGMSITGKYTDLKGNLYYYGAYGENTGGKSKTYNNETKGFFVVKYTSSGKQVWLKKIEINDKDINENASKNNLNSCLDMVNDKLRFTLTKHKFDQYFYYAHINPETGELENSSKIIFKVDSVNMSTFLTTPLLSFFKIESQKYLRLDFNSMYFYQTNPKIKKYMDNFTDKNEIHFQSQFNKDGIFLSESDTKNYYKITFFKF